MLYRRTEELSGARGGAARPDGSILEGLDIASMLTVARRQIWPVVLCALVGLVGGVAFGQVAQTRFTAQADLLIDTRQVRTVQDLSVVANASYDPTLIDNQLQVLQSENVMEAVIEKLALENDPEFNGREPESTFSMVMRQIRTVMNPLAWFEPARPASDPSYRIERTAVSRLQRAIEISRVGRSNVVQISATSRDAEKAALIANTVAEQYLTEQLASRFDAAQRAGAWLQGRIEELRQQSELADRAVERFRSENNLLATNGQLVSDQQLASTNDELIRVQGDVARAQARYDSLRRIIESRDLDAVISEALDNTIINRLRQQIIEATQLRATIVARLGENHQQARNLANEIEGYRRQMFEELGRIAAGYRNDLDVAKDREAAVLAALTELKQVTAVANDSQIQLRKLEQEANIYRTLYQSFLQRYQETVQQESFPLNEARVITAASKPLAASEPRKTLLAMLGLIAGIGAGVAFAAWREFADRTFRTPEQVADLLGVEVLGMLPDIAANGRRGGAAAAEFDPALGLYTVRNPFSSYSETLRAIKVSIDLAIAGDRGRIIGIASSMPREGKSTLSKNFASLLAMQGARVILVDADLRQAGVTRLAAPQARAGLLEVLLDEKPLEETLVVEEETGLAILPAIIQPSFFQTSEAMSSPSMEALLHELVKTYDYVILDLPPLGPVTDARAVARLIDAFLLLVAWGEVPRSVVKDALAASPGVRDKLIGAVLNKVEVKRLRMYQPYGLDEKQMELMNRYYR
jgi:succinoglycan biosynthesis transport protein ExoP